MALRDEGASSCSASSVGQATVVRLVKLRSSCLQALQFKSYLHSKRGHLARASAGFECAPTSPYLPRHHPCEHTVFAILGGTARVQKTPTGRVY